MMYIDLGFIKKAYVCLPDSLKICTLKVGKCMDPSFFSEFNEKYYFPGHETHITKWYMEENVNVVLSPEGRKRASRFIGEPPSYSEAKEMENPALLKQYVTFTPRKIEGWDGRKEIVMKKLIITTIETYSQSMDKKLGLIADLEIVPD